MKIYSIIIFGLAGTRPNVLSQARDINEFGIFKQSTVKEFLLFASREVIARTQPKETQSITQNSKDIEKKFIIHVHVNETKIGGVVITVRHRLSSSCSTRYSFKRNRRNSKSIWK